MIRNLGKELLLLGFAWLILIAIVLWMVVCQVWSDMRWQSSTSQDGIPKSYKVLGDLLLERMPLISQEWIADCFVTSSLVTMLVGCVAMAPGWRARIVLLRRVGWIMATLYLLRSITISVTTLPPSIVNCTPKVAHTSKDWADIIPKMISGKVSGCTDKMYSGHTCLLFISFLTWTRYARHWIFVVYSFVHTSLGIAAVMAVRIHYTVDVVLAITLTFLVHQFYYTVLELAMQKQPAMLRAFGHEGYSQILPCHEQQVAGREEAELEHKAESIALDILPSTAAENSESRHESNWTTDILYCINGNHASTGPNNMLVNRTSLSILPRIVAWLDGLHLR